MMVAGGGDDRGRQREVVVEEAVFTRESKAPPELANGSAGFVCVCIPGVQGIREGVEEADVNDTSRAAGGRRFGDGVRHWGCHWLARDSLARVGAGYLTTRW